MGLFTLLLHFFLLKTKNFPCSARIGDGFPCSAPKLGDPKLGDPKLGDPSLGGGEW